MKFYVLQHTIASIYIFEVCSTSEVTLENILELFLVFQSNNWKFVRS